MMITSVSSNIKRGVTIQLGRRTVLCGPNGSGKSSVVQAVQLAADGALRDGEGREQIKEFGAVARSFNNDDKLLWAKADLDDGRVTEWSIKKSGKTWKGVASPSGGVVVFPFEEVKAKLAQSPIQVRSWLSQLILGNVDVETICGVLTSDEAKFISRMIRQERVEVGWNEVAAAAKKKATSLRREATTKEKTIEQLTEGVEPPRGEEWAARTREEQTANSAALMALRGGTPEEKDALRQRLERAAAEYEELVEVTLPKHEDLLAEMEAQGGALPPATLKRLQEVDELMLRNLRLGVPDCLVCGRPECKTDIEARRAEVQEVLADYDHRVQLSRYVEQVRNQVARLEQTLHEWAQAWKDFVVLDREEQARLLARSQQFATDMADELNRRRAWDNTRAVRSEVAALRSEADLLVSAAETLINVGIKRLSEGVSTFEAEVNKYLPERFRVGVDLEAGRLGFRRDGDLMTSLSGGEWSALLMALAAFSAHTAGSQGQVPVIIPDDRGWDGDTLSSVMEGLASYPGQIIIMSTTVPTRASDGWTVYLARPVAGWELVALPAAAR